MAGLFSTLQATNTALNAQTTAINVTSNNIANINNPNYSEETVDYTDLPMVPTAEGEQSTGITVSVSQQRSAILDQMVREEASLTGGYGQQQSLLQQAQAALGDSISDSATASTSSSSTTTTESGLSAALDSFFNAWQGYAANPTSPAEAGALVQQAQVLTDRFQQIDSNLAQVQTNADTSAGNDVGTANTLLQQVASLNTQILSVDAASPGSALQLQDQREGDLEQLAGLMPVTVTPEANGEVSLSAATAAGGTAALVTNGTVEGTLSYASGTVSVGSTALSLSSGSIDGSITASTGPVQTLRTQLDALANQLVTSVNAAYNPTSTTGGNFFDASGLTAGTISLDPSLTTSTVTAGTGAAGDNTLALAVAGVANQQFSTSGGDQITGTLTSAYAYAASGIGQALDTATTQNDDQTNVQTIVENQRQSASGVSLDQEMSNLMTYQRSYQAASEVFQVVDDLLDQVVNDLTAITS